MKLHTWYGDWLSIRYGEYVFTCCCGLCCFWKLKCGDLLSCCDLSLTFFGLSLYFTEKFHCLIPKGQKDSLLQVLNLGMEIVAERLSWTWISFLMCTPKTIEIINLMCWNWSKTGSLAVVGATAAGHREGLVVNSWWVTSDASLSTLSILLLSISSAISPNSNCGWVSVGTLIFLLLPLGMLIKYMYSFFFKKKNLNLKVQPQRTDFTPSQSSLAQTCNLANLRKKNEKLKIKSCTPVVSHQSKPKWMKCVCRLAFLWPQIWKPTGRKKQKYCRPVGYSSRLVC